MGHRFQSKAIKKNFEKRGERRRVWRAKVIYFVEQREQKRTKF
jgi:hypothetical protein